MKEGVSFRHVLSIFLGREAGAGWRDVIICGIGVPVIFSVIHRLVGLYWDENTAEMVLRWAIGIGLFFLLLLHGGGVASDMDKSCFPFLLSLPIEHSHRIFLFLAQHLVGSVIFLALPLTCTLFLTGHFAIVWTMLLILSLGSAMKGLTIAVNEYYLSYPALRSESHAPVALIPIIVILLCLPVWSRFPLRHFWTDLVVTKEQGVLALILVPMAWAIALHAPAMRIGRKGETAPSAGSKTGPVPGDVSSIGTRNGWTPVRLLDSTMVGGVKSLSLQVWLIILRFEIPFLLLVCAGMVTCVGIFDLLWSRERSWDRFLHDAWRWIIWSLIMVSTGLTGYSPLRIQLSHLQVLPAGPTLVIWNVLLFKLFIIIAIVAPTPRAAEMPDISFLALVLLNIAALLTLVRLAFTSPIKYGGSSLDSSSSGTVLAFSLVIVTLFVVSILEYGWISVTRVILCMVFLLLYMAMHWMWKRF